MESLSVTDSIDHARSFTVAKPVEWGKKISDSLYKLHCIGLYTGQQLEIYSNTTVLDTWLYGIRFRRSQRGHRKDGEML